MKVRAWAPLLLMFGSAGQCGSPPEGRCDGVWGGAAVDAAIDESSSYTLVHKLTCTGIEHNNFVVSWGGGAVTLDASLTRSPSSLLPLDFALPATPGDGIERLTLTPQPEGITGTLRLAIEGVVGRRTGVLEVTAGAEHLRCHFELPLDTEGDAPSCGGGDGD